MTQLRGSTDGDGGTDGGWGMVYFVYLFNHLYFFNFLSATKQIYYHPCPSRRASVHAPETSKSRHLADEGPLVELGLACFVLKLC